MNHHWHESAKKGSRKLATFCFILFLKECLFIYLFIREYFNWNQTMITALMQIIKWAKLLQVSQEILWLVKERAPRVFCSTGGNTTVKVKRE